MHLVFGYAEPNEDLDVYKQYSNRTRRNMIGLKRLRIGLTGDLCEEGNECLASIQFGEFID
jgi:hypothetical protein